MQPSIAVSFVPAIHLLPQFHETSLEPRSYGGDRNSLISRDLFVRELLEVAQQDHSPIRLVEGLDRLHDALLER